MRAFISVFVVLLLVGCSKKKNEVPAPDPGTNVTGTIGSFALILPAKNEICITGTIISDQNSAVTFNWGKPTNASRYEVHITNLITQTEKVKLVTNTTVTDTLQRGMPYSWYVLAKNSDSKQLSTSETWKLYNAGLAINTYAPFPAEITTPTIAKVFNATSSVDLTWAGSAVSNNITGYDVYFGTSATPPLIKSNVAVPYLKGVALSAAGTYYWKVVTRDANGNTSSSMLAWFVSN